MTPLCQGEQPRPGPACIKGTVSRRRREQLKVAKDSAVKARTQAISQLRKAPSHA